MTNNAVIRRKPIIMKTYDILCPYHGAMETIELPDSYDDNYEGEVPCSRSRVGGVPLRLKVKIVNNKIVSLERAR